MLGITTHKPGVPPVTHNTPQYPAVPSDILQYPLLLPNTPVYPAGVTGGCSRVLQVLGVLRGTKGYLFFLLGVQWGTVGYQRVLEITHGYWGYMVVLHKCP